MPIYEYHCNRCGQSGEFLEKRDAPASRKCPNCGRRTFNRQLSAAAFHLKGTGWYATDFRDKGKIPSSSADDKKPDSKSDSAVSKADSAAVDSAAKPDKKAESASSAQKPEKKSGGTK